jgi:hypothetical protein
LNATAAVLLGAATLYNGIWSFKASQTIVDREKPGRTALDSFAAFVSSHPDYQFQFSPRLKELLARQAPHLIASQRASANAGPSRNEYFALYSLEHDWSDIEANRPGRIARDFGPYDVNLAYYPTWIGSDHILLFTPDSLPPGATQIFDDEPLLLRVLTRMWQEEIPRIHHSDVTVESYLGFRPSLTHDYQPIEAIYGRPYSWNIRAVDLPGFFGRGFYAFHDLLFRVRILHPDETYDLGLTFWDFDGGGRTESVQLETAGRKPIVSLMNGYVLPVYWDRPTQKVRGNRPVSLALKMPKEAYADGSVLVRIVLKHGSNVVVSEVWTARHEALPPA